MNSKMDELVKILAELGILTKNSQLLKQAFIHRSYLNEAQSHLPSNERLEFLGDSILSFLVSEYLYIKYPDLPEGELTNLRSSIVKTHTLASSASSLHLGKFLFLSKGEVESGGRNNPSILADTFESLIGALYLTLGLSSVKKLIETHLLPKLETILNEKSYRDAKSRFQEVVQEKTKLSPTYTVLSESGPDHSKEFTIGVYVGSTLWGKGKGKSKQQAEQEAATVALEKWQKK